MGDLFFRWCLFPTAATIVSGAMAERIKFSGYLIGTLMTCGLIYPVVASWAWVAIMAVKAGLPSLDLLILPALWCTLSVGGYAKRALSLNRVLVACCPAMARRVIAGHNLTLVTLGGFILAVGVVLT